MEFPFDLLSDADEAGTFTSGQHAGSLEVARRLAAEIRWRDVPFQDASSAERL